MIVGIKPITILGVVLIVIAIVMMGAGSPLAISGNTVNFYVKNTSGAAVQANIIFGEFIGNTNTAGHIQFTGVPSGDIGYLVRTSDYVAVSGSVSVSADVTTVNVVVGGGVQTLDAGLFGYVTTTEGTGISLASVYFGDTKRAETDANGAYTFSMTATEPITANIYANKGTQTSGSKTVTISAGTMGRVDLVLQDEKTRITFDVYDSATSANIEKAKITIGGSDYYTTARGDVTIDGLLLGEYSVGIEAKGYIPQLVTATVGADPSVVTIQMIAFTEVTGRIEGVIRVKGETIPISNALIEAVNINTNVVYKMNSNTDGFYRMSVPAGTYRVSASAAGFITATLPNDTDVKQDMDSTASIYLESNTSWDDEGGYPEGVETPINWTVIGIVGVLGLVALAIGIKYRR